MTKVSVKVLTEKQTDTCPFVPKNVPRQVAFNSSVLDEPTKHKYYDRERMSEINMERVGDQLYCKIQKLVALP